MANAPVTLHDLKSIQVIGRFCLRMIVLCVFAALGGNGFGRTLAALLLLSTILCVVAATFRRETPFDRCLTHWDEAAMYGLVYGLLSTLDQLAAP